MRLLMDEHGLGWEHAWDITRKTFAFTNHTLLPEALERWPLDLFGKVLPRHLQIIERVDRFFIDELNGVASEIQPESVKAIDYDDGNGGSVQRTVRVTAEALDRVFELARTAIDNRSATDFAVQVQVLTGGFQRLLFESALIAAVEGELADSGRVVLRASGTEPVIRVMVEGEDAKLVDSLAERLASVVAEAAASQTQ